MRTRWERAKSAWRTLARQTYDVVLLDVWLPGIDGMETLARIQEIPFADRPEVVMISGHGNHRNRRQGHQARRLRFPRKAADHREGHRGARTTPSSSAGWRLELSRAEGNRRHVAAIIGDSVPMKALRQQLALMAATNGRVLIFGESGTGKELVAHAIHAASARSGSFRRSELRGDPRRADRKRAVRPPQGQLRRARSRIRSASSQKADGGTLFLDEVGDM